MKVNSIAILLFSTLSFFGCNSEPDQAKKEVHESFSKKETHESNDDSEETNKNLKKENSDEIKPSGDVVTTQSIKLKDITVTLVQKTPAKGNYNYTCYSKITTSVDDEFIDSLIFENVEGVGGSYGLTSPVIMNDHVILTKHGDYDGKTIVINEHGKVFSFIGGENYIDEEAGLLFTIYESDLSGNAVFDLEADSLIWSIDEFENRAWSIHKEFGQRYFMNCFHDETDENTVWEFEFDLGRIMQVDLDSNDISSSNQLKTIALNEANCVCKQHNE